MNQSPAQDMMSYLNYVGNEWAKGWLQRSNVDRSGIFVPTVYIRMTDNLYDAYALAQIMYWSELSEDFKPRLKHLFQDHLWIVKTYEEWCNELHFPNVRAVRDSFARLKQKGLIIREQHKSPYHNSKVVLFVRMNWSGFGNLLTVVMSGVSETSEVTPQGTSEMTSQGTSEMPQERTSEMTSQGTSLPENTAETTTESTVVKEKESAGAEAAQKDQLSDEINTLDPVTSEEIDTDAAPSSITESVEQTEELIPDPVVTAASPEDTSPAVPQQPKPAPDPVERKVTYKDAIMYAWELEPAPGGRGVEGPLTGQLVGNKKTPGKRGQYALEIPATIPEIVAFGRWYRITKPGTVFNTVAETISENFMLFRQHPDYEKYLDRATDIIAEFALTGKWVPLPRSQAKPPTAPAVPQSGTQTGTSGERVYAHPSHRPLNNSVLGAKPEDILKTGGNDDSDDDDDWMNDPEFAELAAAKRAMLEAVTVRRPGGTAHA